MRFLKRLKENRKKTEKQILKENFYTDIETIETVLEIVDGLKYEKLYPSEVKEVVLQHFLDIYIREMKKIEIREGYKEWKILKNSDG